MPIRAFSPLRRLLIGGLLASVASALLPWSEALADDAKTLRIGYQKFNSINILKGSGALEKALAPQGVKVSWHEFAAGPQLLEALSTAPSTSATPPTHRRCSPRPPANRWCTWPPNSPTHAASAWWYASRTT